MFDRLVRVTVSMSIRTRDAGILVYNHGITGEVGHVYLWANCLVWEAMYYSSIGLRFLSLFTSMFLY
jgi:hypothetical protein